MGVPEGEVLMALPAPLEPITAVRSTLLISSLATLVENGYEDRYFAALPAKFHLVIRTAVAGAWLPVEVGLAHYTACSSLGLSHEGIARLGRGVQGKINGTLLGTAVRMAKEMGVTPLTIIPQFPRFWARAFQGGGCCAYRTGPKDVRIEAHKTAFMDAPYFRSALCGLVMGVLEPFCTRAYMSERPGRRAPLSGVFRIQWV